MALAKEDLTKCMRKQSEFMRILKKIEKFFSSIKHEYYFNYLYYSSNGSELVKLYNQRVKEGYFPNNPIGEKSPIWVCWWQGEENLPDICKACLNTIKLHACRHPVILIDKNNVGNYVEFPKILQHKIDEGKIDFTHQSDILRCLLLKKHGGIWIDITIFLTKDVDLFIPTHKSFWTCRHKQLINNICNGWWSCNFFATGKEHIIPSFILDLFINHFKKHDDFKVYLWLDYAFTIGRRKINIINQIAKNQQYSKILGLKRQLNNPYNEKEWEYFVNEFNFQKLSYKVCLKKEPPDGRETVYGHFFKLYGK